MSDDYRDGCSKRAGVIAWLVVSLVQAAAWLSDFGGRIKPRR